MSMIHQIKVLQSHDYSVCAIGAQLGCDRKTVRKHLQQRGFFSPRASETRAGTFYLNILHSRYRQRDR